MTAGSGIIHQEMPKPAERLLGAQLWLNLPAKDKMVSPKYRPLTKKDIPVIDEKDKKIHIIAGAYKEHKGAIEGDYIKALYIDVEIDANAGWILETDPGHTLFIYILRGSASFGEEDERIIPEKHVVLFGEGKNFRLKASDKGIRFLLMSGKPLKEPIAWGGPIVMNTREELNLAFQELENKTFIK